MELKQILEEADKLQPFVDKDLDTVEWKVRAAWGVKKTDSKLEQAKLKKEYGKALAPRIVKILLTGSPERANELVELFKSTNVVVVDGSTVYDHVAKRVEGILDHRDRLFHQTYQYRMTTELQIFCQENGLDRPKEVKVDVKDDLKQVPHYGDVLGIVRKSIRATNGDKVNCDYLMKEFIEDAYRKRLDGQVIVCVVKGLTPDESEAISKGVYGDRPTVNVKLQSSMIVDEKLLEVINKKIASLLNK